MVNAHMLHNKKTRRNIPLELVYKTYSLPVKILRMTRSTSGRLTGVDDFQYRILETQTEVEGQSSKLAKSVQTVTSTEQEEL
jgi:hypothetical protein